MQGFDGKIGRYHGSWVRILDRAADGRLVIAHGADGTMMLVNSDEVTNYGKDVV